MPTAIRTDRPRRSGVSPWTDATQGMHGAFAILAALYHKRKTGEGQYIDAAMIEGSANLLGEMIMGYTINQDLPERQGNRDAYMAPHGCYPCKGEDEWVTIAVSNQNEWQAFCRVIGNPEWTLNEEFADELSRWRNQDKLDDLVSEWTRSYSQYEVMEKMQKAGVSAGASLNVRDIVNDPQLKERGFFLEMQHAVIGKLTLASIPLRLSDTPAGTSTPPPLLGEHNDYVFGELLGLSSDEIARLEEQQVIY